MLAVCHLQQICYLVNIPALPYFDIFEHLIAVEVEEVLEGEGTMVGFLNPY